MLRPGGIQCIERLTLKPALISLFDNLNTSHLFQTNLILHSEHWSDLTRVKNLLQPLFDASTLLSSSKQMNYSKALVF